MIKFVEETHQYFDGDKELISVTTLMQKHGLAPNYAGVNQDVLKAKAERGTLIHQEIEDYNKTGEIGFTNELINFKEYIESHNITVLDSEIVEHNDIVAGTVDLVLMSEKGPTVADIKTTSTLHKDAVSWQLSIYTYLINEAKEEEYNATSGQAFHFDKEGSLNVVDIKLKPFDEVTRLLECERKGEIYKPTLNVTDNQLIELANIEGVIQRYEIKRKEAEAQAIELRAALMGAMESNGVKSFENDRIRIIYIDPQTRTTIDSARLKKEQPEIAEQYSKTSQTKASLRITLKEDKQ